MKELMKKANFPSDAAAEVMEKENVLKGNGNWDRIIGLAEEIMRELPGSDGLRAKLHQAEGWEQELGIHKYMLDLLVLLRCWEILEKRYEEKGLPMEIFYGCLDDMRCKLLECRDVYGVNGIFVGFWYDRFFDITRFALGRLQFETETYPYDEAYEESGIAVKKGDTVINMHIPSSGPLRKEEVDDALSRAAEFYKDKFPGEAVVFVMDSWLLDPDLGVLFPEGNLKDFVRRFTLLHSKKEDTFEDGWRVFGSEWQKDPKDLPRRSALQRNIADYLQQGGKLGEGYGILIFKK